MDTDQYADKHGYIYTYFYTDKLSYTVGFSFGYDYTEYIKYPDRYCKPFRNTYLYTDIYGYKHADCYRHLYRHAYIYIYNDADNDQYRDKNNDVYKYAVTNIDADNFANYYSHEYMDTFGIGFVYGNAVIYVYDYYDFYCDRDIH